MTSVASKIGATELPLAAGAANAPIAEPLLNLLLAYCGHWIKTSVDPQLSLLEGPSVAAGVAVAVTDACPEATRYPHAPGSWWLLTGAIAIPVGYLLGHQIAFLLLGEPLRMVGFHQVSLVPLLFTVLVGGLGLRHFAIREHLAHEAATRAEAQRLAVEAQLRLLRTQLEPHMLFNTLANLRGLVREDVDRAETMIDRLIVYLRATLAASRTESVPLGREFAQLRAYLEIMSLRMGPRLAWHLDLPAELDNTPVPPMLLQPLAENAIKHGLEPKVGAGRIDIVARQVAAGVEICIEDDGLGPLALDDEAAGSPHTTDSSSYGLRHVRERLQAVYGPAARLTLEPRNPQGTRALVLLPHHRPQDPP
jgi:signal transduction histidine kinase